MPLTDKGAEIKGAMAKEYGPEKGEKVFYASKNKGTISGVDEGGDTTKDFTESIAGPALSMALSDEDMETAMDRFDEVRDGIHKLDKRIDDCDMAQHDDRSSEGHAEAAKAAIPGSVEEKFHKAEVGRED